MDEHWLASKDSGITGRRDKKCYAVEVKSMQRAERNRESSKIYFTQRDGHEGVLVYNNFLSLGESYNNQNT